MGYESTDTFDGLMSIIVLNSNDILPVRNRYVFAQFLRAVAALSVVFAHYFGTFWSSNKEVLGLAGLPPLENLPSLDSGILKWVVPWQLVIGQFGVGIFFCISGFVICIALENESRVTFLIRRAFRIFPTYMCGFLMMVLIFYLIGRTIGSVFPYSTGHIFAHLFPGFLGFTNYSRIDGISWTLEVEVWFYVVAMCLSQCLITKHKIIAATIPAIAISIAILLSFVNSNAQVSIQFSCSILLVSGYIGFLNVRGTLNLFRYWLWSTYLTVLLIVYWVVAHYNFNLSYDWLWGYLLALAGWHTTFFLRESVLAGKTAGHFANISYPLYVVHALAGYAIMFVVFPITKSVLLSGIIAFLIVYLLSIGLRVFVEKPTIELGRRASRMFSSPDLRP